MDFFIKILCNVCFKMIVGGMCRKIKPAPSTRGASFIMIVR